MRILDLEKVRKQSLGYKLELICSRAKEVAEKQGGTVGFFLADLCGELGWKNPGGSQIRKLRAALTEMGLKLEKIYDADKNTVAWFAYIE